MSILTDHPLGLLWAYRFRQGNPSPLIDEPIPVDLRDGDGWIWAHFPLSDHRARNFLLRLEDVPLDARDLLLGPECPPRILFKDAWAYGVLPDFDREFDGRTAGLGRLRFAFDGYRLITVRKHALQIPDDMHNQLAARHAAFSEPLDAFVAMNKRYCEIAEDQLSDLADRLDEIEDQVLVGQNLERIELGPLRRDLSRRHREIAALRVAYHRAPSRQLHTNVHALAPRLPFLEQQSEDLDRAITSLQDRARLIHEEIDTKITSATNRTLRALTIMSVILMPPTLIVGAFGMNVDGIPFAKSPEGFALASGVCALAIIAAYGLLLRLRILR